MKKENKKIIMFITNGLFSNIFINQLNHEELLNVQDESEIKSLIICLNNNYITKENIITDDLTFNHYEKEIQKKNEATTIQKEEKDEILAEKEKKNKIFIEQLIDLKKRKIKQSIINERFRNISLKLNNFEKKVNAIKKEYASFIKEKDEYLNINEFTSFFINFEYINKQENINLEYKFDELEKVIINEKIEEKIDYEIKALFLLFLSPLFRTRNSVLFVDSLGQRWSPFG